jgi:diguanylate cyclase (GGDEF)-like protein
MPGYWKLRNCVKPLPLSSTPCEQINGCGGIVARCVGVGADSRYRCDCYAGSRAVADCLRQVAKSINKIIVRTTDLVARFGGEEFVCILPETDQEGAFSIAEKLRLGVMALAIPQSVSSVAACLTISLGVVTTSCEAGKTALSIVAQADEQLYAAKTAGRNRICAIHCG